MSLYRENGMRPLLAPCLGTGMKLDLAQPCVQWHPSHALITPN